MRMFLIVLSIILLSPSYLLSKEPTQVNLESIHNACGSDLACIFKECGELFQNIKDIDTCYYEILETQKALTSASKQQINGIYINCNREFLCIAEECAKFADSNQCSDKVIELGKQKDAQARKEKQFETTEDSKVVPPPGKWTISRSNSPMDDSKTVSIILDAENYISAYHNKSEKPTLIIRCRENKTEIYIRTNVSANPELGLYNEFTVRIRLDEKKSFKQRWSESTDGEALFAPRSIKLAKEINKSKKMLFEFIPYNSDPQLAEFRVEGLEPYLKELADTCNWKL